MVCQCLSLTYIYFNITKILPIEDINSSNSYAKCDVISRQDKKFKLKYLSNNALQRKSIKELVL